MQTLLETKRLYGSCAACAKPEPSCANSCTSNPPAALAGALKVGAQGAEEHDDLTLAVALAVWAGRLPTAGGETNPAGSSVRQASGLSIPTRGIRHPFTRFPHH